MRLEQELVAENDVLDVIGKGVQHSEWNPNRLIVDMCGYVGQHYFLPRSDYGFGAGYPALFLALGDLEAKPLDRALGYQIPIATGIEERANFDDSAIRILRGYQHMAYIIVSLQCDQN